MEKMQEIIGKNIEKARIIRKVSVAELAARLGISKNKLKKYESGQEFPPDEMIADITALLKISLNFILFVPQQKKSVIRLKTSEISERDKNSVIELAKYKATLIESFISNEMAPSFPSIAEDISLNSADEDGKKVAVCCLSYKNLADFLKTNGLWVVRLPADTALFRGLFIRENETNIIMIPENYIKNNDELVRIIAHEFCHAIIFQKQQKAHTAMSIQEEEDFCSKFSKSFAETYLKAQNFEIGNIDFLKEKVIDSWENDKISTSLAAELLGISEEAFRESFRK